LAVAHRRVVFCRIHDVELKLLVYKCPY
jgi:hypothetical protein